MIKVRAATLADLRAVAGLMRESDRKRCMEVAGLSPMAALMRCWKGSTRRKFATVDGEPAALWGMKANSLLDHTAQPWLVITKYAERVPVSLIKIARQELSDMNEIHPLLIDFVQTEDMRMIRFAQMLGFEVDTEITTLLGMPFHMCAIGAP